MGQTDIRQEQKATRSKGERGKGDPEAFNEGHHVHAPGPGDLGKPSQQLACLLLGHPKVHAVQQERKLALVHGAVAVEINVGPADAGIEANPSARETLCCGVDGKTRRPIRSA